jgi:hypothetical protein
MLTIEYSRTLKNFPLEIFLFEFSFFENFNIFER